MKTFLQAFIPVLCSSTWVLGRILEVSVLPGNYLEVLPPFDGEARERRVSHRRMAASSPWPHDPHLTL